MTRRLLVSYVALAAVVLLVLAVPLAATFERLERRNLTDRIERDAVVLASVAEDALEADAHGAGFSEVRAFADAYTAETRGRVIIVDSNGDAVADTSGEPQDRGRSFASRPEIREALGGRVAVGERFSRTLDQNLMYVAVPVASGGRIHGAVRITYPTDEADGRVHRVWLMLLGLGITVLALAAMLGMYFARVIARPLARVERTAVAAGEGDLSVRAPVEGPPEVRSLATRFNGMITRLGELVRSQEAFVADASHQLRTPLAALRLRLENLEATSPPDDAERFDAAVAEVDRLNRMVDGLLLLARADAAGIGAGPIDAGEVVRERVDLWSALAAEQGVDLHADPGTDAVVVADGDRLEQVLDNLIENALGAIGERGGTIRVRAVRDGRRVRVTVTDDGPGMDAADRQRAFDRFWRSERRSSEGTGLGLAIVRRMVEADGGHITLEEASGGGLEARIDYPAATRG